MDLINRQDAIDAVYERIHQIGYEDNPKVLSVRQVIRDLPSAEPYTDEEIQRMSDLEQAEIDKAYELGKESMRKKGKWIPIGDVDSDNNQLYECNQCHKSDLHAVNVDVPYCWYCGAKMEDWR